MTIQDLIAQAQAGNLYAFGALPSPPSPKDHTFPAAGNFPATYMSPAYRKVPVRNQQGGTCVGNSLATCLSYLEYGATKNVVGFSGEEINAQVVHKWGEAISPHDGLDLLIKNGANVEGTDYYLQAYANVDHTNNASVKAAISTPNTMVTAACWLLQGFGDNEGTVYQSDNPGENPWAYHELTFVGYDDKGVIFQNSWDTNWGDGGFGRFAWGYVNNRLGECWAITTDLSNAANYDKDYTPPSQSAGRAVRRVGTQAVYLAYTNGLLWVQSLAQAKALGVDMRKVENLPLTDKVWNLPIIGIDAPAQYR